MHKPFYFFPIYFYSLVTIWMLGGFFNFSLKLTFAWLPYAFILFIYALFYQKSSKFNKTFLLLIFFILLTAFISLLINLLRAYTPPILHLFSFTMYFGVILLLLSIYLFKWDEINIKKMHKIFFAIFIINLIISTIIFIGTNLDFIPKSLFYVNQKYTVIGFNFIGNLQIRNPGIFESGSTNGFFILFFSTYLLSYIIFYKKNTIYFWIFILSSIIIFSTFTRRVIVAFIVSTILIYAISLLKKRLRYGIVIVLLFSVTFTSLILYYEKILALFKTSSLDSRTEYWNIGITNLINNSEHLLYGYNLIQVVVSKANTMGISNLPITTTDNIYLSMLSYGGIVFLFLWLIYFLIIAYYSFSKVIKLNIKNNDYYIAVYLLVSSMLLGFLGFLGNYMTNIQESFIIWFWNTILFVYLHRRKV